MVTEQINSHLVSELTVAQQEAQTFLKVMLGVYLLVLSGFSDILLYKFRSVVFKIRGVIFISQGICGNVWQHFWVLFTTGKLLLVCSRHRPGCCWIFYNKRESLWHERNIQVKMSIVLTEGNPALDYHRPLTINSMNKWQLFFL